MQLTLVLSILLLLSLVHKQSAIHVLNTTAYSAFYATSCTRSSPSDVYPLSCNPFNISSLWLPSTIVYNGTVNISSDSLLTFVVSTLPSPLFFALSSSYCCVSSFISSQYIYQDGIFFFCIRFLLYIFCDTFDLKDRYQREL